MPSISMKNNSIRNCSIDKCLHNVCKDSSTICKKRCPQFLESFKHSNPDSIGSYQIDSGITDISNEKSNSNGVRNFVVQDGLFPHQQDPLVISDTLEVKDIRLVTDGTLDCRPVCHDETARVDACENAEMNEHSTAVNHWFLDNSWCFNQFALNVDAFNAINPETAELDCFLKSHIQGFSTELAFPSAMMEDILMMPSLEEAINAPFGQVRNFWTSSNNDPQLLVTSDSLSDVCYPTAAVDFGFMDSEETETVDPLPFIKSVLNLSSFEANLLPALLPQETIQKRVTLVLDLDETLIHSTGQPCANADFSFKLTTNMAEKTFYVRQRPFLKEFLERVLEMFEIILFTASQRTYAEPLLGCLDPEGKFFSRCAFRDSCVLADGVFTKDLIVFGVDLAKVAIIDNTPQVFRWQVSNGIPIKSWYDDPFDSELINLLPFLETLVNVDDVRAIISQKFGGMGQV